MNSFKTLILGALIAPTIISPSLANEIDPIGSDFDRLQTIQISTKNDLQLTCNALSSEALRMSNVIHATQEIKNNADMRSNGVTAAGAIGSLLIGTATGGIGLAIGGFLMHQNIEEHSDKADDIQDIAAQRRTLMLGIYNAKGCHGPTEHATQSPEEFNPIGKIALGTQVEPSTQHRKPYND